MATTSGNNEAKETRPRVGPVQFVREVRTEVNKVTWPTWGEWRITTLMVFIFVVIATVFFFAIDSLIAFIVQQLIAS
ncbi:MAG: preprotein translocase subunit SecE [Micropepsaceae bacterium]